MALLVNKMSRSPNRDRELSLHRLTQTLPSNCSGSLRSKSIEVENLSASIGGAIAAIHLFGTWYLVLICDHEQGLLEGLIHGLTSE